MSIVDTPPPPGSRDGNRAGVSELKDRIVRLRFNGDASTEAFFNDFQVGCLQINRSFSR